jgi:hypothetical protein
MPYEIYKILHILGLLLVFTSLGGVFVYAGNGGLKTENRMRKLVAISHGTGLLFLLVSGFGMLAKLGISGFPFWVLLKLGIWLGIGALLFLGYRKPALATRFWAIAVAAGVLAAIMGIYKIG